MGLLIENEVIEDGAMCTKCGEFKTWDKLRKRNQPGVYNTSCHDCYKNHYNKQAPPSALVPDVLSNDWNRKQSQDFVDDKRQAYASDRFDWYDFNKGKGYKALGYESFSACVKMEFDDISVSYASQLLQWARVEILLFGEVSARANKTPMNVKYAIELAKLSEDVARMKKAYEAFVAIQGDYEPSRKLNVLKNLVAQQLGKPAASTDSARVDDADVISPRNANFSEPAMAASTDCQTHAPDDSATRIDHHTSDIPRSKPATPESVPDLEEVKNAFNTGLAWIDDDHVPTTPDEVDNIERVLADFLVWMRSKIDRLNNY